MIKHNYPIYLIYLFSINHNFYSQSLVFFNYIIKPLEVLSLTYNKTPIQLKTFNVHSSIDQLTSTTHYAITKNCINESENISKSFFLFAFPKFYLFNLSEKFLYF